MTAAPVVELVGVAKSFGRRGREAGDLVEVLTGVDLTIRAGDKASLVGPSGTGKSTLLSLIAGLLRPDSGTVAVDGVSMGGLSESDRAHLRAERIGIALQADNLIPFLTARENVEIAIAFGRRSRRRAARQHAQELLERFGVGHRADHRPRHLSGGEAQRVALAVSVANEPALLLADEVVAQLDGESAAHVVDEVLAADFAVLYVTHDAALADRVPLRYEIAGNTVGPR